MNKVIIIGNLGSDPELRTTPSGQSVVNVRLATNEFYGKGEERTQHTEWHNLVFWGGQAETVAKYAKKGQSLVVDGHLRTRQFERTVDGKKVPAERTEIYVEKFEFHGTRRQGTTTTTETQELPAFATAEAGSVTDGSDLNL